MKLITEEQAAIAYEEATDGCRRSVLGTRDNAGQWQRFKPDEETNPLAGFDCDDVANRGKEDQTSVIHTADLANPIRVGADVLAVLLAHELDYSW